MCQNCLLEASVEHIVLLSPLEGVIEVRARLWAGAWSLEMIFKSAD
jgi:hypothetical protein